jgi:hypothetical protein
MDTVIPTATAYHHTEPLVIVRLVLNAGFAGVFLILLTIWLGVRITACDFWASASILIVVGTSIWVGTDSWLNRVSDHWAISQESKYGNWLLDAISQWGWCCLILWIYFFPHYLVKRHRQLDLRGETRKAMTGTIVGVVLGLIGAMNMMIWVFVGNVSTAGSGPRFGTLTGMSTPETQVRGYLDARFRNESGVLFVALDADTSEIAPFTVYGYRINNVSGDIVSATIFFKNKGRTTDIHQTFRFTVRDKQIVKIE